VRVGHARRVRVRDELARCHKVSLLTKVLPEGSRGEPRPRPGNGKRAPEHPRKRDRLVRGEVGRSAHTPTARHRGVGVAHVGPEERVERRSVRVRPGGRTGGGVPDRPVVAHDPGRVRARFHGELHIARAPGRREHIAEGGARKTRLDPVTGGPCLGCGASCSANDGRRIRPVDVRRDLDFLEHVGRIQENAVERLSGSHRGKARPVTRREGQRRVGHEKPGGERPEAVSDFLRCHDVAPGGLRSVAGLGFGDHLKHST
jgi:hypothetical protein